MKTRYKKLIYNCFVVAVSVLLPVTFIWAAVSGAWFYKTGGDELFFNPVEFGAELRLNGEETADFRFKLSCATKLDRNNEELGILPSDPGYDSDNDYIRDRYFNGYAFGTKVTIENIGAIAIKPRVTVELEETSALRSAVLLLDLDYEPDPQDINAEELVFDQFLLGGGAEYPGNERYIDYRHYIWESLDAWEASTSQSYAAGTATDKLNILNAMNAEAGGMSGVVLEPSEMHTFAIITWVDYDALLDLEDEYGGKLYYINPAAAASSVFTLKLKIRAADIYAP